MGHDIAEEVSHRAITMEAWVHSQAGSCLIYGEEYNVGTLYKHLMCFSFPISVIPSLLCIHSYIPHLSFPLTIAKAM